MLLRRPITTRDAPAPLARPAMPAGPARPVPAPGGGLPRPSVPGQGESAPTPRYRNLGDALLHRGVITQEQHERAHSERKSNGGFIGQILIDFGFVTQDAIVSFLVKECKIPHLSLLDYEIGVELFQIVPEEMCRQYSLMPIDKLGKILTVAMADPLDTDALLAIQKFCPDLRIKTILCNWQHFKTVADRVFEKKEAPSGDFGLAASAATSAPPKPAPAKPVKPAEEDKRIEDMVDQLLADHLKPVHATPPPAPAAKAPAAESAAPPPKPSAPISSGAARDEAASVVKTGHDDLVKAGRETQANPMVSVRSFGKAYVPRIADLDDSDRRILDELTAAGPDEGLTFENFLPGKVNVFTFKLSEAVSRNPGGEYNPFFLFGKVGVGKTHLVNAVGHAISERSRELRVGYVSASHFAQRVLQAHHEQAIDLFRRNYCHWDVLILDDIQFLGGRVEAQEEFFHIFNVLHHEQRQIIIAGDKAPDKLGLLEQRLVSRFASGIVAELKPPDLETRMGILRKSAQQMRAALSDEVLALIAKRVPSDVRTMTGALRKVAAFAKLLGGEVSTEAAADILSHLGAPEAA